MLIAFYFSGTIVLILGCCFLILKITDWYRDYIKGKFPTNHEYFISDLYKLQRKWASNGEIIYANSINEIIIKYTTLREKAKLPKAENFGSDIASTLQNLENNKIERLKDILLENDEIKKW